MLGRFSTALAVRLVNAFVSTAFFQADEYFQAWEVAYADIHGVGFRSWEWLAAIRTSLVPRAFVGLLNFSSYLEIDHLLLCKIVMAFLAAVSDCYTASTADLIVSGRGQTAFLLSLGSTFNWYCATRPFSNTFEMVLVAVAVYYWTKAELTKGWFPLVLAQLLANIAIALRPSGAIFWIVLGMSLVAARPWRSGLIICAGSSVVSLVTQSMIAALDADYYASVQKLPVVEFIRHNFGSRISEIYGVLPWHWYISQGLPFLLLGYLPLVAAGLQHFSRRWLIVLATTVLGFSLVPHKEFRFLYFLLPLLHIVAAVGVPRVPQWLVRLGVFVNAVASIYFSYFHQRGVVDVVEYVRRTPQITDVAFLMPCHSTPWHAHFQRHNDPDFNPRFLTCNPPWNLTNSTGYVDVADRFYLDPERFLSKNPEWLAQTVVVFEPLEELLAARGYNTTLRMFNGLFNEDWRRQGHVLVMQRN